MSVRAHMRPTLRRRRPGPIPDRLERYLTDVEQALAIATRVHRSARPPTIGDPGLRPLPLAVWIEGEGEQAMRTRIAPAASTPNPVMILRPAPGARVAPPEWRA